MFYPQKDTADVTIPVSVPPNVHPTYNTYNNKNKDPNHQAVEANNTHSETRFNFGFNHWKDRWFALLFILQLGGVIAVAAVYGYRSVQAIRNDNSTHNDDNDNANSIDGAQALGIVGLSCLVGFGFSLLWLAVIQLFAATIIRVSLIASIIFYGASTIAFFVSGFFTAGVISAVLAVLTLLYFYVVRNRIPFSEAILVSCTQSVKTNYGTIIVAYLMVVLQIIWLFVWSFAAIGLFRTSTPNQGSTGQGFLYALLILSFFWTQQVLANISHVTTAGAVASWWFVPDLQQSVTKKSFKRATTSSLGSICFGSLIVAVLQTLRALVNSRREDGGNPFILCILQCIEGLIEYFNMYAYTEVAIYGKDFLTAARHTWQLIKSRGIDILINDDLSWAVLSLGCILSGVAAAIGGALWAYYAGFNGWETMAVLSFLVGYMITSIVMSVIRSAVATTFVIWAEDPNAMKQNRPTDFSRIADASRAIYP